MSINIKTVFDRSSVCRLCMLISSVAYALTLKMKAISSSETLEHKRPYSSVLELSLILNICSPYQDRTEFGVI
jgi:hypothetical protein